VSTFPPPAAPLYTVVGYSRNGLTYFQNNKSTHTCKHNMCTRTRDDVHASFFTRASRQPKQPPTHLPLLSSSRKHPDAVRGANPTTSLDDHANDPESRRTNHWQPPHCCLRFSSSPNNHLTKNKSRDSEALHTRPIRPTTPTPSLFLFLSSLWTRNKPPRSSRKQNFCQPKKSKFQQTYQHENDS
jgi:hypothetical protein